LPKRAHRPGRVRRRIGDDDLKRRPERLAQRNRQRKASKTHAADQRVDTLCALRQ
jgi:hypothetical protein